MSHGIGVGTIVKRNVDGATFLIVNKVEGLNVVGTNNCDVYYSLRSTCESATLHSKIVEKEFSVVVSEPKQRLYRMYGAPVIVIGRVSGCYDVYNTASKSCTLIGIDLFCEVTGCRVKRRNGQTLP